MTDPIPRNSFRSALAILGFEFGNFAIATFHYLLLKQSYLPVVTNTFELITISLFWLLTFLSSLYAFNKWYV